ncbi:unnamed protein product [Staurois parvus]|uniref:Uncharacterized protein n=1 Tax=Staurois parvus TaxID=386267 RepID=A0ABN9ESB0_9NEOB|nr:unnamed protein product [Staurois parvus]
MTAALSRIGHDSGGTDQYRIYFIWIKQRASSQLRPNRIVRLG